MTSRKNATALSRSSAMVYTGAGGHKIEQVVVKRPLAMYCIKFGGLFARETNHFQVYNPKVFFFESANDFTNYILCNSVGFDDEQGAFHA